MDDRIAIFYPRSPSSTVNRLFLFRTPSSCRSIFALFLARAEFRVGVGESRTRHPVCASWSAHNLTEGNIFRKEERSMFGTSVCVNVCPSFEGPVHEEFRLRSMWRIRKIPICSSRKPPALTKPTCLAEDLLNREPFFRQRREFSLPVATAWRGNLPPTSQVPKFYGHPKTHTGVEKVATYPLLTRSVRNKLSIICRIPDGSPFPGRESCLSSAGPKKSVCFLSWRPRLF